MKHDISILVAEDNTLFREALRLLLGEREHITVIGEAGDGLTAVELTKELKPDLVLMDLSLPEYSGVQAIRKIKNDDAKTKVLVLTVHGEDENLFSAFSAGADGYILKDASSHEFFLAIESVMNGLVYVCPNVARIVVNGFLAARQQSGPMPGLNSLTSREREILGHIAKGMKNKEIGAALEISTKTVEKHRSNILKKLKLNSPRELPALARQANLLIGLD